MSTGISEAKIKPDLNPEQQKAASADPKIPLLIVAGAGTGKTRTLTSRVRHFLLAGGGRDKICAITFTNKAAREMESRVGKLGAGHFIGTFHSLGAKILRKNASRIGRTNGFIIFDENDSFALIKKILKTLEIKKESPADIRNRISNRKNSSTIKPDANENFEAIFLAYEQSLKNANAFDFDDLIHKTVMILSQDADLREKYQRHFKHILVDEYQDVNPMQNSLVKLLAGEGTSVSVVGDAEQTIYGWRGSDIEIFLRFPDEWKDAETVTLVQNYRSTGNILRAASGVILKNVYDTKIERAVNLWTENLDGKPVTIYEAYDEDSEAEWIGNRVVAEPDIETAILYRTNAQSRALEQALLRRRVPYRVYGGLKFYERREIKDIIAGLRAALNTNDELSWERLNKTFPQKVRREIISAFKEINSASKPLEIIEIFLAATNYIEYLERTTSNPRERTENVEELLRFASEFDETPKFLEEITLLQATDEVGEKSERGMREESKINLLTIHLAKGLEFDRVFIAGCTEGLMPHARSMESSEQIQEERRLMYVAMTRARKELYLSFYGIPSRFLGEIPTDVVRFESAEFVDQMPLDDEERYITMD